MKCDFITSLTSVDSIDDLNQITNTFLSAISDLGENIEPNNDFQIQTLNVNSFLQKT